MNSNLHTILSENARPIVIAAETERKVMQQHYRHCIAGWAFINLELMMAVASLERSAGLSTRQHEVPIKVSEKIRRLGRVLPDDWSERDRLVSALWSSIRYRDALAHWTLGMSGKSGSRSYGWNLWKYTPKQDYRIELTSARMRREELTVDVLREAVLLTIRPLGPLAEAIESQPGTWDTREHRDAFLRRSREMFPATDA